MNQGLGFPSSTDVIPEGWIVHATFPNDRYTFVLVDDVWVCYAPDHHERIP